MKSVILDIFNGKRGHIDSMRMPIESKSGNEKCDAFEELKENLSPKQFELFEKFVEALENDLSGEIDFYFAEGFKLGLLIGIECGD